MRRQVRYLVGLLLPLVLLVTACGGGSSGGTASKTDSSAPAAKDATTSYNAAQTAPAPAATTTAQPGGTLVIVTAQKPAHLDPNVHSSRYTTMVNFNTHDPMVWQVEPNKYAPGLAERWENTPDYKSYTFYLRKDVKFHDGTPLNAEAVKFSWDRIADPKTRSLRAPELGKYDKTEVIDEYTVRITFKEPYPTFFASASNISLSPQSPTAIKAAGEAYLKMPVGTGPFKVESWPNENTLVLAKNPDYKWGPKHMPNQGSAYLDKVVFKYVTEEVTRTVALEKGEAHVAEEPSRQTYPIFKSDKKFQPMLFKTSGLPQHWAFNVTRYPTNDLAVRQAFLYALDKQKIMDTVFFSTVTPATGPLADSNWAYWSEAKKYYPYDPKKAMELLQKAGYTQNPTTKIFEKDGKPVRMRLVTTSTNDQTRTAQMAQAMLKEVGIDLVIEAMVYDATVDRYAKNDYELGRLGLSGFDPDVVWRAFHSSQITSGSQFNRARLDDKAFDALLDKARALTSPDERKPLYFDIQKYLLENASAAFMWEDHYYFAGLGCVKGWSWEMGGSYQFHNVWLEGDCRKITG